MARAYPDPNTYESLNVVSYCITIPDHILFRAALESSFHFLQKWVAWNQDGTDGAKRTAELWREVATIQADCMTPECCDQILNQLSNLTQIVTAIQNKNDQILEELDVNVTVESNPTINVYGGCGCTPTVTPTPTPDPTPDPDNVPDIPPTPSTDPLPDTVSFLDWKCKASHRSAQSYTEFFINASNTSGSFEEQLEEYETWVRLIPFMSGFGSILSQFVQGVRDFNSIIPWSDIITFLQDTEEARACILYSANSPSQAKQNYVSYMSQGLIDTYGLTLGVPMWYLMIPVTSLFDWEAIYTEGSIDVSGITADCSNCQEGDPYSPENITDWGSISMCLSPVNPQVASLSSGVSAQQVTNRMVKIESIQDRQTTAVLRFPRPNYNNVLGFIVQVENASGIPLPRVGGVSTGGHISRQLATGSNGVIVYGKDELIDQLEGAFPAQFIRSFNDPPTELLWLELDSVASLDIGNASYIYECEAPDGQFYLFINDAFGIEPENWAITGSGQSFAIKNGVRSDGQTENVPNVDNGLISQNRRIIFNDWSTDGTRNIRIRFMPWLGSTVTKRVRILFTDSNLNESILAIDTPTREQEYIWETPALFPAGVYDIELLDDETGEFLYNVAIYGCEEF